MPLRSPRALAIVASLVLAAACGPSGASTSPGGASPGSGTPQAGSPSAAVPSATAVDATATAGATETAGGTATAGASPTDGATSTPAASQVAATGELSILGFNYETGDQIAKVRIDRFKSANPEATLKITEGGLDQQQFLTAVQSGKPPDLVYVARNDLGTYVAQGALEPLDQCVTTAGIDMAQYYDAAVTQVKVDDVVYAIPEFYNTRVLIINNKALKEVGLTADDIDTSDWAKITEANQKLMIKNGGKLGRIGFDPKMPEFLPLWSQINGATMLSEDGKTSNLEDPKIAEALRFTTDLIKAHGTGPEFFAYRETSGKDFFGGENQFATNVLGAFPMEQWYVNVLAENSPDVDITVKALKTKAGEETSFADGNSWAIPRGAKNPEAACQFMKQMTAPDTWVAAATERAKTREAEGKPNTGVYTGNREADRIIFSEVYKPSGKKAFDDAVQVILKAQESAFSLPPSPAAAQFDKEWRAAVDRVLNENVSPEEALKEADEAAQQALDEAAAGE